MEVPNIKTLFVMAGTIATLASCNQTENSVLTDGTTVDVNDTKTGAVVQIITEDPKTQAKDTGYYNLVPLKEDTYGNPDVVGLSMYISDASPDSMFNDKPLWSEFKTSELFKKTDVNGANSAKTHLEHANGLVAAIQGNKLQAAAKELEQTNPVRFEKVVRNGWNRKMVHVALRKQDK